VLYFQRIFGVNRAVAGLLTMSAGERKVRTPQGNGLANGQAGRPDDKCNREQTSRWPRARKGMRIR